MTRIADNFAFMISCWNWKGWAYYICSIVGHCMLSVSTNSHILDDIPNRNAAVKL